MAADNGPQTEYERMVAFYDQLAEFVRTHRIDDIDKMVMDGSFAEEWPDIGANAPLAELPKWDELKPADPSQISWLGRVEVTPDSERAGELARKPAEHGYLHIDLRRLSAVTADFARKLACALDVTVSDGLRIAGRAPVAALSGTAWTRFQIPLGMYFQDVLHISDEIVRQWAEATLSVQPRPEGVRFVLNSPPDGWALAVSLDRGDAEVLDGHSPSRTIACVAAATDRPQMAIVPFRP